MSIASRFLALPLSRSLALALSLAACAPAATTNAPAPAPARVVPVDIRWTRASAEHRALFLEIYHHAMGVIDSSSERWNAQHNAAWAVIMDADETVIDNSWYQQSRAAVDSGFTDASWNAWVAKGAAPALPGAAEFIRHVRQIGGHVVIVTNRSQSGCAPTIANFHALALPVDTVLCRTTTGDKNPRFNAVLQGTAGLPPYVPLMWVGDNIQDFPDGAQDIRLQPDSAFARFGTTFIVLPNPMYGSWEKNPLP